TVDASTIAPEQSPGIAPARRVATLPGPSADRTVTLIASSGTPLQRSRRAKKRRNVPASSNNGSRRRRPGPKVLQLRAASAADADVAAGDGAVADAPPKKQPPAAPIRPRRTRRRVSNRLGRPAPPSRVTRTNPLLRGSRRSAIWISRPSLGARTTSSATRLARRTGRAPNQRRTQSAPHGATSKRATT